MSLFRFIHIGEPIPLGILHDGFVTESASGMKTTSIIVFIPIIRFVPFQDPMIEPGHCLEGMDIPDESKDP
jgi:hypothetical protein